jgi:hypothetical protein
MIDASWVIEYIIKYITGVKEYMPVVADTEVSGTVLPCIVATSARCRS